MSETPRPRRLRPLLSSVVLRSQSDARLGALAAAGNQQAFTTIYERYRRELATHARRIVRPDRAEDVVQHAMLAVWSALLSGVEIADLRAWLHRVVHNAALDTVSRRGYDHGAIPESSVAPGDTAQLAAERVRAASALAAIAALPESQRRALTLTAIEGRTGDEAAREMGISESAIRQLVYRARTGVRRAVTAITPVPLVNWVASAAAGPEPMAAVGLGAGGTATTLAKVIAVMGVTAGTLGATHALERHHSHASARLATIHASAAGPDHPDRAQASGGPQPAVADHSSAAGSQGPGRFSGGVSAHTEAPRREAVGSRQHQPGSRGRAGEASGEGQPNRSVTDAMPAGQSGTDESPSHSDPSSTRPNQDHASTETDPSAANPATTSTSPSPTTTGSSPTGTDQSPPSPGD